jgi:predicted nucleic acid-binding protein
MDRLFVDTSAWLAFVNRKDEAHEQVRRLLARHEDRLVTTNFVFDETVTLAAARLGHGAAVRVGDLLREPEVVTLVRITARDESEGWKLFGERPDKKYSFTDCTSFVVMRRLGLDRAAALDEDFRREGFLLEP